jgi:hypothetical protein
MSAQSKLSRAEEAILAKMGDLDPDSPRFRVLEAALAFKASWVIFAEHLSDVARMEAFRAWGYASFAAYCSEELFVSTATAKKLVKSFRWLESEAPTYLPDPDKNGFKVAQRPIPDFRTLEVLADAQKEVADDRVPEDAYLRLRQAAFDGEHTSAQLRRELKAAIPEESRIEPVVDKAKTLRKALTATVKVIDLLHSWDGDPGLVKDAEALRDAIVHRLPRGPQSS